MSSFGSPTGKVLYLVVCAATGADRTLDRIRSEQAAGWDVCPIVTPRAMHWIDPGAVEALSGHAIQSTMRRFGEPLFEPLGDAMLVTPASFNTINKVAVGMADNMATGLICEALGRDVPITMEPEVGPAFGAHPAFATHVGLLEQHGVHFVWNERTPRPPTTD